MAAISRSSVMAVSARKMLKRQVVVMIGKGTLVRVKEDLQRKLGHGVTYTHKTERTIKEKRATKAKLYEKISRKFEVLASTHVRS